MTQRPLIEKLPSKRKTPSKTASKTASKTTRRLHHHVYVVELDRAVWQEPRFRKSNPSYVFGKLCVYVGMTGLSPDIRFDKHKAGIQANRFVTQYGLRLRPEFYDAYNPTTYDEARTLEVELAIDFREAGFGVWQA